MPADLALLPIGQRMLVQLKNADTTGLTLIERIGRFFPQSTDFEWLTNPDSRTFLDVFYNEESSTGWLTNDEYNEFWGYASDYCDFVEKSAESEQDPGALVFDGHTGLVAFLTPVVDQWENANQPTATGEPDNDVGTDTATTDWDEQRAKYLYNLVLTRDPALDQAAAWSAVWEAVGRKETDDEAVVRDVIAAQRPQATTKIDPFTVGRVAGYLGLWQGYDAAVPDWKYIESEFVPVAEDEGWTTREEVDWDGLRAKHLYDTVLTREPALDQAAAWSAIWEAVGRKQADDETVIRDVIAAQRPQAAAEPATTTIALEPAAAEAVSAIRDQYIEAGLKAAERAGVRGRASERQWVAYLEHRMSEQLRTLDPAVLAG
jgi:hypothetical protein